MFSSFRMVVPENDSSGNTVPPTRGLIKILAGKYSLQCQILICNNSSIYTLSRGHPLVLELINRGSVETFHSTLEALLKRKFSVNYQASKTTSRGDCSIP